VAVPAHLADHLSPITQEGGNTAEGSSQTHQGCVVPAMVIKGKARPLYIHLAAISQAVPRSGTLR
jgi:hypothetical protein